MRSRRDACCVFRAPARSRSRHLILFFMSLHLLDTIDSIHLRSAAYPTFVALEANTNTSNCPNQPTIAIYPNNQQTWSFPAWSDLIRKLCDLELNGRQGDESQEVIVRWTCSCNTCQKCTLLRSMASWYYLKCMPEILCILWLAWCCIFLGSHSLVLIPLTHAFMLHTIIL